MLLIGLDCYLSIMTLTVYGLALRMLSVDVALVQSDLNAISEWSIANELPISLPKCCALHYGSSNSKHQYGQRFNSVSECADLGVLRSDTFQPHVRAVALKAARLASMVTKMFASHDRDFLIKLFCAYIRPVVEYASPVWSPEDVASCVLLENVQRRFTKRISGMSCLSYEERLDELKLHSLQQRREQCDLLLIHKSLQGRNVPPSVLGLQVQHSLTRHDGGLHMRPNSALLAKHFCCRAPVLWSSLLCTLRNVASHAGFKAKLLTFMSSHSRVLAHHVLYEHLCIYMLVCNIGRGCALLKHVFLHLPNTINKLIAANLLANLLISSTGYTQKWSHISAYSQCWRLATD
jgi:hypothetical protein